MPSGLWELRPMLGLEQSGRWAWLRLQASKREYSKTQRLVAIDVRESWERLGVPFAGCDDYDDSGGVRDDDGARGAPPAVPPQHRTRNGSLYVIQNMTRNLPLVPVWWVLNAYAFCERRPSGQLVLNNRKLVHESTVNQHSSTLFIDSA